MFVPSYLRLPQVGKAASWEQLAQSLALAQTSAAAFVCPVSSMEYLAIKPLLVRENVTFLFMQLSFVAICIVVEHKIRR